MCKPVILFVTGIIASRFYPFFPISVTVFLVAAYSSFFCSVFPWKNGGAGCRGKGKGRVLKALAATFLFAGIICFPSGSGDSPELEFGDEEYLVAGNVAGPVAAREGRAYLTVDRVSVNGENVTGKIRLVLFQEKINLNTVGSLCDGDSIIASARLRRPLVYRNPGVHTFYQGRYGIVATGYVLRLQTVKRGAGLMSWFCRKRVRLGHIMDESLSAENALFLKAIIPGLKTGLGVEIRDAFNAAGLAHLLSISGTHLGLLAFIVFRTVKGGIKLLPERLLTRMSLHTTPTQISVLMTLPVLVFYTLISGAGIPTVRSLIMISVYMTAVFLGRRGQWLNSLAIAAFVILVYKPGALFDISFMLSFAAVLSIGYTLEKYSSHGDPGPEYMIRGPVKQGFVRRGMQKVKTALLITVAAAAGTAPVVAAVFHQFSFIAPAANLLVTPFVCFLVLPLGFLSGFSAVLFGMSSMPLGGLLDFLVHLGLAAVAFFADIPFSSARVHDPSFIVSVLYFLSLRYIIAGRGFKRVLPFVLIVCIYIFVPDNGNGKFRVTFLDVGQGDASFIELPDGKNMLIDGGTAVPDTGRKVVAPFLWSRGINRVDYLVSSHLHKDHLGGLPYILDNFHIGEIWLNGRVTDDGTSFLEKIKGKKVSARIPSRGACIERSRYRIQVLHPYDVFYAGSARGAFSNENSDSLVIRIDSDYGSVLFTGDIEREAEDDLAYLGRHLRSNVVKVPHHGAGTSSSEVFIASVAPDIAVISAGKGNPFGHPHPETLARFRAAGVKVFRTDRSGAVTVTMRDRSYTVTTYEDGRFIEAGSWRDEFRNLRLLFKGGR